MNFGTEMRTPPLYFFDFIFSLLELFRQGFRLKNNNNPVLVLLQVLVNLSFDFHPIFGNRIVSG